MLSSNQPLPGTTTAPATPMDAPPRSILVVDDEPTLRSALRRFFTRRGWRVVEAEDGECARSMLLDGEILGGGFDAVISDMRMPRLSGIELHAAVAAAAPDVAQRFLFSSGDTGDDEAVDFLARTHCPVIPKPFDLGVLLSLVERVAVTASQPH
ncbi:MAG: response regulator [Gemmatimonadota bacterium]